jgi:hypothetical protein
VTHEKQLVGLGWDKLKNNLSHFPNKIFSRRQNKTEKRIAKSNCEALEMLILA